jgi:hypothetical protein
MHSAFLKELESHPGLDYHRYTVLQLLLPDVYNEQYLSAQTFEDKYFYRKEGKHGYGGMQADTANQVCMYTTRPTSYTCSMYFLELKSCNTRTTTSRAPTTSAG